MRNAKGFTMVELLVVLVIIAILAAVATPMYLANAKRAKASEAIATMSMIRQAQRDYTLNHPGNIIISSVGGIENQPPTGAGITIGTAQYFSAAAYTTNTVSFYNAIEQGVFTNYDADNNGTADNLPAQNYIVKADGALGSSNSNGNFQCASSTETNCAMRARDVENVQLLMDGTGRTFVCYGTCGTAGNWGVY